MAELSRFYGIVIRMYGNDHAPPHFHAVYADPSALVDIATLRMIRGDLPRRARNLVAEWAQLHQAELAQSWEQLN
ncbi:MAG: DUF4160 domain-containing protein, partial [Acidimicrobiales bacterium]|nr:DUF4160 domain-containing protein [Acidimicrobiales bacterium]